jgi:hypothetical protein
VTRLNRDTVVAAVLLVVWAAFLAASFDIRETTYGTMGSEVWPRAILAALVVLTLGYLVQSLGRPGAPVAAGAGGWLGRHRNAAWCFALFALFLITLPWLGMLLGGAAFVFALLTALGHREPRHLALHAAIAVGAVGLMWAIFTFGLGVILPEGEILRVR